MNPSTQTSASATPATTRITEGDPSSPEHVTYSAPRGSNASMFGVSSAPPPGPRATTSRPPAASQRTTSPLPASHAYTRPRPSTARPSMDPPLRATSVTSPSSVTA